MSQVPGQRSPSCRQPCDQPIRKREGEDTEMIEASELVRQCRAFKGLTQRELAARSGVSQQTISNAERGAFATSFDVVVRLLDAMDFDLELTVKRRRRK